MEYFELTVTAYMLDDIHFTKANEIIGKTINRVMYLDKALSEKHIQKGYKHYCYGSFYPTEKDKVYKNGRIYVFKIRSLESEFAGKMQNLIEDVRSNEIKVMAVQVKRRAKRRIVELHTVTPAIVTVDNKHWLPQDDITLLKDRLQANLEKKYRDFYGEGLNVSQRFIEKLELLNKKVMSLNYKDTRLLGNKFRIVVNGDECSQRLAFIAEAVGLGEKSSANGMGFCNAQYLKVRNRRQIKSR